MAKNREPILKTCKSLGLSPATLGVMKETTRNMKQKRRNRASMAYSSTRNRRLNLSTAFWRNLSTDTMRWL